MFIEPSLAGGFLWQGANMRSSYKTTGPCHLLSAPVALITPGRTQSRCDGLSHLKEDTGEPSVPARESNLIACRQQQEANPRPAELASQAHCTAAPRALAH